MADKKKSAQELIDVYKQLDVLIDIDIKKTNSLYSATKKRAFIGEQIQNNQKIINELKSKEVKLTSSEFDFLKKIEAKNRDLTANLKKQNNLLEIKKGLQSTIVSQFKMWKTYLMEADSIIKSTNLSLGLSGTKAEAMRASFEQSTGYVASLGGSIADVGKIMTGYADETGRARAMSASMVEDVTKIGLGTGLGIEQATKLSAEFEYMGLNSKRAVEYVQGVVDTSERMGVNTTKVLKDVTKNFKKLGTFTFQSGVKGFAEMAQSAERTRVSMETALNVAEATRGLEKVIELGANLQIMGGEFSKMDPFEWLYTARNEPDKLTEKISKMTTGIYSFKKNSEGVFEKFISPADRDRLASVAKSLGISNEEMFEIGKRRLDLNEMAKEMMGLGLSPDQKKVIDGAATLGKDGKTFQVELAGNIINVADLTKEQAENFKVEQKTLAERAKEALTFDKALKATINELKSAVLPILRGVNVVLGVAREIVKPIVNFLTGDKFLPAWLKVPAAFLLAATAWKSIGIMLGGVSQGLKAAVAQTVSGGAMSTAGNIGGRNAAQTLAGGKAAGYAGKGAGAARAGIGAAALGIGAGIGIAAVGIGQLAKSMERLDATQIELLPNIMYGLAAAIAAFTIPLAFLGPALTTGAVGFLAFGAAALGIGAGIGIATAGIGLMAEGIGTMLEKTKDTGDLLSIAAGIGAIGLSLMTLSNPLTLAGLGMFTATMGVITLSSLASAKVASSFTEMGTAMKGTKDDWIAIESAINSISKAKITGGGVLAELAQILKKPLVVEFSKQSVEFISDITLEIDGQRFMQKVFKAPIAAEATVNAKNGVEE